MQLRKLTKTEMLMASAIAHLALADTLEAQGEYSITTRELRSRAQAELQYLEADNERT